eukprot:4899434-Amphidinium_carterae.1
MAHPSIRCKEGNAMPGSFDLHEGTTSSLLFSLRQLRGGQTGHPKSFRPCQSPRAPGYAHGKKVSNLDHQSAHVPTPS